MDTQYINCKVKPIGFTTQLPFHKTTVTDNRLQLIDFLKGYSIFTIIIFHYLLPIGLPFGLDKAIMFGGAGVHLFLFMSGFGLMLSNINKHLSYSDFLIKRLSKVYFPYVLLVSISAIISFFIPIYSNSLYAFGGHLLLYKMFDNSIVESYGYQLWFISTIIQFYLIFNILVFIKKRLGNSRFLILGLFISIGWGIFVTLTKNAELRIWNSFFPQYLWEFSMGMIVADFYKQGKLNPESVNKYYYLIAAIFAIILYGFLAEKLGPIGKIFNDIPSLIGYSSLAILIFNLRISWINRLFLYTGKISYLLYLIHILILLILEKIAFSMNIPVLIIIPLALGSSYFFAGILQKPIDKLSNQMLSLFQKQNYF